MADDISLVVGVDYTELTGLVKTTDQTKKALGSISREFARTGDQRQYMRGINQLVVAQKRLDEASRLSRSEIMKLGAQMQQEAKFAQALTNATMGLSNAQMAATKSSNRMGVVTQQAGYQVSDFIVQVQSGTNAFVAFGQQASQLVGVLPLIASPLGLTAGAAVALSAGLGIAIPLVTAIGAAISRSGEAAKEATKDLKTYEDAIESLTKRADDFQKKRLSLTTEFDEDVLIASEKRIKLVNLIAQKQIESLSYTGKDLELSQNLIATLEEQLSKESEIVSKAVKRNRLEEERLQKVKAAAEWESGAEERRLEFLKRRDDFLGYFNSQIEANAKAEQDAIKKAEKLEKGRQKATEDSFNALMKSIEANDRANEQIERANKRAEEKQKSINAGARDRLRLLDQQNNVLEYQIKYGTESERVEALKNYHTLTNLRLSLEKQGVDESIVRVLVNQQEKLLTNKSILQDINEEAKTLKRLMEVDYIAIDPESQLMEMSLTPSKQRGPEEPKDKEKRDPVAELRKQLDVEEALVGKTEARKRVIQALGVDYKKYGKDTINSLEAQINRTIILQRLEEDRIQKLEDARQKQKEVADDIAGSMGDAFMSIVDGTKSVKDAFRDMARYIIGRLYEILVVEQMVQSISGAIQGAMIGPVQGPMLPSANGNVFSNGSVVPYANGGVVGSPVYFPMAGGRTGLMGEAGPEAIMPLKRGKNGKLGVQADGGGDITINQNFNFSANGDESVKKIIAQQAPKIAQMTQQQIMDSRRRGGQMKAVFG